MVALFFLALLLVAWVGEAPRDLDTSLYSGLWRSPLEIFASLFVPVPGIRLFPWQLLLFALLPVCLAAPNAFRNRSRELDVSIAMSLTSVAITFAWGLAQGGGAYEAYFQLWKFLAALLIAYLLPSIIRTAAHFRALAFTILIAALIRATLVMYFYWAYVRGKVTNIEYMTNHDDSMLFVTAILIVGSWALINGGRAAWTFAISQSSYLFYAMALNNRRIAWVELTVAAVVIYVLIGSSPLRRQINRWLILAAPIIFAYVVIGWGQDGPLFAPLRSFSTVGSMTDTSSLAREEENANLLYTMSVAGNPVLGTGWGIPYLRLTRYWNNYSLDWTLALYTPHNSLLGLAVFAGVVGILGIWLVVPVAAYLAARGYARTTQPIYRAAALVAAGILPAFSAHCYGDIGLQSFASCLIFGVALGTAARVTAIAASPVAYVKSNDGARAHPKPLRRTSDTIHGPPRGSAGEKASQRSVRPAALDSSGRRDRRLPPPRRPA